VEWGRVKTILIGFLLLVNAILLVVYVQRRSETAAIEEEDKQNLVRLLEARGVSVSADVLPDSGETAAVYELPRNLEQELALVERILGQAEAADQGGNIMLYESEAGNARFRGEGNFDFTFSQPLALDLPKDMLRGVEDFLRQAGYAINGDNRLIPVDNGYYAVFGQEIDGYPIFDQNMTAQLSADGALAGLSGRWVMGTPVRIQEQSAKSAAFALLSFVDILENAGTPCSQITEVKLGYITDSAGNGYVRLTPVWRITADGVMRYVDSLTGNLVATD